MNLTAGTSIYDGHGNLASQKTYNYDEASVASSGISMQHIALPAGTIRGNLTSVSQLATGGTVATASCPSSNTTITTHTSYYDTGEVYQNTDACGNTSTTTYDPAYGGAYPTGFQNALHQVSSKTYDYNTGAVLTETDPNHNTTSYSYGDILRTPILADTGRLTDIIQADGGWPNHHKCSGGPFTRSSLRVSGEHQRPEPATGQQ